MSGHGRFSKATARRLTHHNRCIAIGLCSKDTTMQELDIDEPTTTGPWRSYGYLYFGSGRVDRAGEMIGYGEAFGTGDVVGCHVDLARGMMYFRKNGRRIGESESEFESLSNSSWALGQDHDMRGS